MKPISKEEIDLRFMKLQCLFMGNIFDNSGFEKIADDCYELENEIAIRMSCLNKKE